MFRGVPGFTLSSLSIRVPAWKKNICCEICFLAFRGCHRKYTTIIQRQNPTQVAYLAHAHIEDRNRGPPLDFAGDFNVVTENASLNLWIVRSGLYLLYIYHLPICADICLYVFFWLLANCQYMLIFAFMFVWLLRSIEWSHSLFAEVLGKLGLPLHYRELLHLILRFIPLIQWTVDNDGYQRCIFCVQHWLKPRHRKQPSCSKGWFQCRTSPRTPRRVNDLKRIYCTKMKVKFWFYE